MSVLEVLSLGAGVQSTTVLLKSLHGELPRFDHIIFADTGWEPMAVYSHLERLKAEVAKHGQTIDVVSVGNIRDDHVAPHGRLLIRNPRKYPHYQGKQRTFIPFYVVTDRPSADPALGRTRRTCTKTYKIEPVEKRIRQILGLKPGERWPTTPTVRQSMGISWDEAQRVRISERPAIELVYPLIESAPGLMDRRLTRTDCEAWLEAHGWGDTPRSACIGCPFHRNDEWRRMRDTDPEAWADAIDFDHTFRQRVRDGLTALNGIPYLHDSRVPLDQADIDDPEENQLSIFEGTIFGAQREGFCGT